MKRILGLDLGTNSIGWALIENDFKEKKGQILGLGSRIIPMDAKQMGAFDSGQSISATADRTQARGMRRLYQRRKLRRERLHRVLNILGFLPAHYANEIDFEIKLGQFKPGHEPKLAYRKDEDGNYNFIFQESFNEMVEDFNAQGQYIKLPYDWTLYYLRKKALSKRLNKEELAWILLNFNQKRGYYQSRDEDLDGPKNKLEEYFKLTVSNVEESEKGRRGIWYNVVLENGWIYRRESTEPLFDWVGMEKEFIVTTTLDINGIPKKDSVGNIKRSFRAVDSEKDWIAIKKKTEDEIKGSEETVGEYIYTTLLKNPHQKIRGKLVKTIERKFYKDELKAILDTQLKFNSEFQNEELFEKAIHELYKHNEAHKNNLRKYGYSTQDKFRNLFIDDILFYQRPLKSQKSTLANCPFESRTYLKDGEKIEQPLKVIHKSHPVYQEFRLWQFIHNLKIYERESKIDYKLEINQDVTGEHIKSEDNYIELFDFLNSRKEINQKALLKYFKLNERTHRWNYVEDKQYPVNPLKSEIENKLKDIQGYQLDKHLNYNFLQHLWHIIYSVRDQEQYSLALKTFARKNGLDEESFQNAFIKMNFENNYGSFSEKAIKKFLPLMRRGKYWNEEAILENTRKRILSILERLKTIDFKMEKIESISDDDIPKQILKSFAKSDNPFKGLNTYQASYAVYGRHSEASEILKWCKPDDIAKYLANFRQHSLRNPIVEQIISETLRVVTSIWEYYGEGREDYFDEIHIELGRGMKNSAEVRKKITDAINRNTYTNERIKNLLQELMTDDEVEGEINPYSKGHQEILKLFEEGVDARGIEDYMGVKKDDIEKIKNRITPTKSEINKYKLWLQQGYISPYTGEIIPLSKLFTSEYEVEHIIPRSRYFDDSMSNKIICENAINPYPWKGNKTAYTFIQEREKTIVPELSINGKTVKIFSIEEYEDHCKIHFKNNKKKLKLLLSEDIPEGFIERQMNDSRYISNVVKTLLSNIVREEGEQETTSKNLVPVVGQITSELKADWGLNDVWDELLTPRFERMNELTNSEDFRFEIQDSRGNKKMINTVPDELSTGFTKKRLDHRHHALDALVIACVTKDHTNLLNNKHANSKNERFDLKYKLRKLEVKAIPDRKTGGTRKVNKWKAFYKPWPTFTQDAKEELETTVVSFKQNKRIINRATNKYLGWKIVDGTKRKVLQDQKGNNWAIRKSLHKATYYGKIDGIKTPKGKIATASRVSLSDITTMKKLESITDTGIQKILKNHLANYIDNKGKHNFEFAFSSEGVQDLNIKIQSLNDGKPHTPIYKVRTYEIGNKFPLGETGNNPSKYVEADKGTNLFFNIYWDEEKQKRNYETVPLEAVVAHQKIEASLPKSERTEVPINPVFGKFLFTLSPDDLVYVPDEEEIENLNLVDFSNLEKNQVERIYKMEKSSGVECYFTLANIANLIKKYDPKSKYGELGSQNKLMTSMDKQGYKISERCWKIEIDKLGQIKVLKN